LTIHTKNPYLGSKMEGLIIKKYNIRP
jgi:hypothetical protein